MKKTSNLMLVPYIFFITSMVHGMQSDVANNLSTLQKNLVGLKDTIIGKPSKPTPAEALRIEQETINAIADGLKKYANPFEFLEWLKKQYSSTYDKIKYSQQLKKLFEEKFNFDPVSYDFILSSAEEMERRFSDATVKELIIKIQSNDNSGFSSKTVVEGQLKHYLKEKIRKWGALFAKPEKFYQATLKEMLQDITNNVYKNPLEPAKEFIALPIDVRKFKEWNEIDQLFIQKWGISIRDADYVRILIQQGNIDLAINKLEERKKHQWVQDLLSELTITGQSYQEALDEVRQKVINNAYKNPLEAAKILAKFPGEERQKLKVQWNELDGIFGKKWQLSIRNAESLNELIDKGNIRLTLDKLQQWKNQPWAQDLLKELSGAETIQTKGEDPIKKQILEQLANPQTRNPFIFVKWMRINDFWKDEYTQDTEINEAFKNKFNITRNLNSTYRMLPLKRADREMLQNMSFMHLFATAMTEDTTETLRRDNQWQDWASEYIHTIIGR